MGPLQIQMLRKLKENLEEQKNETNDVHDRILTDLPSKNSIHEYRNEMDAYNVATDLINISYIKNTIGLIADSLSISIDTLKEQKLKEVQEIAPVTLNIKSELEKLEVSTKNYGIDVTNNENSHELGDTYAFAVLVNEGQGFGGIGKYSYDTSYIKTNFNGIFLNEDMIINNKNIYFDALNKFDTDNGNIEERYNNILRKLSSYEKKLKVPILKNKIIKDSIYLSFISEKEKLEQLILKRRTLENKSNIFNSLTNEQKEAILNYYKNSKEIIKPGINYLSKINECINLNPFSLITPNYIKELIDSGIIDIEDLTRIYNYIDGINNKDETIINELKNTKKEYSTGDNTNREILAFIIKNKNQINELLNQKKI